MKTSAVFVYTIMALIASAGFAQSGSQPSSELPSAPSAAIAPAKTPEPPKTKMAQPQAPAEDKAPVLQSLEERKPAPPAAEPRNDAATIEPQAESAPPPDPPPPDGQTAADADAPEEGITTIRKRVEEVSVIFTVTDKRGRFMKDLKKEDFSVADDSRPVASIRDFRAETDLPLRVGLLVDASNSIRDRFKFEQESAIEFLNQIVRPRRDLGFIIGFDSSPEITQDFTDSTEKLSRGIHMLRPGGGTALYDALYYAARDKLMKRKEKETVRRAIILLSDGDDNQSRVTREEAIEMAQRAEVIVYVISTSGGPDKGRGDKVLERIADATGGRAFFPFKVQDVANAFADIQDELRSQYAISYKPPDFAADGRYRSINITALNKKLRVRARKGYFAPRQ